MFKKHLKIENFRKWLESQSNNGIVGDVHNSKNNPLVRYLRSLNLIKEPREISFHSNTIYIFNKNNSMTKAEAIPFWITRFNYLIKPYPTKQDCLNTLKEVEDYEIQRTDKFSQRYSI